MNSFLCLTLRFLDPVPRFHGRGDDGDPEWPPSPLRLFQALVCASASRWRDNRFRENARPALQWLETIQPSIVAPQVSADTFGYRMYVPNNSGDLMTAAWARGDSETSMAKFRVEKDVRPTHLCGGDAVHYLFPLIDGDPEFAKHRQTLIDAAWSVTHLGWGIDMVAGNASVISEEEAAKLPGEAWRPSPHAQSRDLRVPVSGTLDALISKHEAFLNRLGPDGFKPVPPLSAFRVVRYRRDRDPVRRPVAAFNILKLDASGFRPFDTVRWGRCVAGMLRHAARVTAQNSGWPKEKTDSFILGHGETPGEVHKPVGPERFAYLPLPSIERRKDAGRVVSSIRRALLASLGNEGHSEITWARRQMSGVELVPDRNGKFVAEWGANNHSNHGPIALLSLLPESDSGVKPYIMPSHEWTTVTPVALPGSDEGKANKTDKLFEKVFRYAGYSLDSVKEFNFHRVPFLRGPDLATAYRPKAPHYLSNCTMYHMRIRWKHPMPGPIALGSGRFCGLGLFAGES